MFSSNYIVICASVLEQANGKIMRYDFIKLAYEER